MNTIVEPGNAIGPFSSDLHKNYFRTMYNGRSQLASDSLEQCYCSAVAFPSRFEHPLIS